MSGYVNDNGVLLGRIMEGDKATTYDVDYETIYLNEVCLLSWLKTYNPQRTKLGDAVFEMLQFLFPYVSRYTGEMSSTLDALMNLSKGFRPDTDYFIDWAYQNTSLTIPGERFNIFMSEFPNELWESFHEGLHHIDYGDFDTTAFAENGKWELFTINGEHHVWLDLGYYLDVGEKMTGVYKIDSDDFFEPPEDYYIFLDHDLLEGLSYENGDSLSKYLRSDLKFRSWDAIKNQHIMTDHGRLTPKPLIDGLGFDNDILLPQPIFKKFLEIETEGDWGYWFHRHGYALPPVVFVMKDGDVVLIGDDTLSSPITAEEIYLWNPLKMTYENNVLFVNQGDS